jgi:hypothetical protein
MTTGSEAGQTKSFDKKELQLLPNGGGGGEGPGAHGEGLVGGYGEGSYEPPPVRSAAAAGFRFGADFPTGSTDSPGLPRGPLEAVGRGLALPVDALQAVGQGLAAAGKSAAGKAASAGASIYTGVVAGGAALYGQTQGGAAAAGAAVGSRLAGLSAGSRFTPGGWRGGVSLPLRAPGGGRARLRSNMRGLWTPLAAEDGAQRGEGRGVYTVFREPVRSPPPLSPQRLSNGSPTTLQRLSNGYVTALQRITNGYLTALQQLSNSSPTAL